jgi:hypothetical protein
VEDSDEIQPCPGDQVRVGNLRLQILADQPGLWRVVLPSLDPRAAKNLNHE